MKTKQQNILLLVLVILLAGALAYMIAKNQDGSPSSKTAISGWQVYDNQKFNYSVQYPPGWQMSTFQDANNIDLGTGVALFPAGIDPSKEGGITVEESGMWGYDCNSSFEEFVKTYGPNAIQNYEELVTMKAVTTKSGEQGYETTWRYTPLSSIEGTSKKPAEDAISLPITLFQDKAQCSDSVGHIAIKLDNSKYLSEFEQIVSTFQFTK